VFVYKFKDGKILSINEYNSDLLVATRLYKNKLVPLD
jgi:ketosteroid isomerase-like protein